MKRSNDYTMQEWRDYYAEQYRKAEDNYQNSGVARYDRERYRYYKIVEAFDGYLELQRRKREEAKCQQQKDSRW